MSKVGTHPYIREKKGDNPVQSLLEVVEYTNYAHLRRKSPKGDITPNLLLPIIPNGIYIGSLGITMPEIAVGVMGYSNTVGSRQIVGSNNQLGGIYVN